MSQPSNLFIYTKEYYEGRASDLASRSVQLETFCKDNGIVVTVIALHTGRLTIKPYSNLGGPDHSHVYRVEDTNAFNMLRLMYGHYIYTIPGGIGNTKNDLRNYISRIRDKDDGYEPFRQDGVTGE